MYPEKVEESDNDPNAGHSKNYPLAHRLSKSNSRIRSAIEAKKHL